MTVDLQLAVADEHGVPHEDTISNWLQALFSRTGLTPGGICIRVVDSEEMQMFNLNYRNKDRPTNVLAFPFEPISGLETDHLGDIVICMPVVVSESKQQDKPVIVHFAHMVIHGTLHLYGYDHQDDPEAQEMEGLERTILEEIFSEQLMT